MEHRSLGASGVETSVIGFGAWVLGLDWWGHVDDDQARSLVHRALDLGITLFDTADVYGDGRGEELLAKALDGHRDEVAIGTKFGYVLGGDREHAQGERPQDWSPEAIRASLEASLSRLRTDHVELYELHNARMDAITRDDVFETLDSLIDEGKIRSYGVALGPAIGWEAEGIAAINRTGVDALQTVYNVLEQAPGESFIEEIKRTGAETSLLARVPHASDVLSEQVDETTEFDVSDHRSHRKKREIADLVAKKKQIEFLKDSGRTMGQAALSFVLAQAEFASVLVTTTDETRLAEYAEAPMNPLEASEVEEVERLWHRNFDVDTGYSPSLKV